MAIAKKVEKLKKIFSNFKDPQEKYNYIIDCGRGLLPLAERFKIEKNKIKNCQSTTYIRSYSKDNLIFFEASSNALVSSGLAAILINVFSREKPEHIIQHSADILKETDLLKIVSLNRINGFLEMTKRIKEDALKLLTVQRPN